MSLLKRKDWAHEIYAGNSGQGHEDNGYITDFSLNLRLTDSGLENWNEIMEIIFQYIKLLKEMPESEEKRIYDEIERIEQLNWLSQEEKSSYDNVEETAESMMLYETEEKGRYKKVSAENLRKFSDLDKWANKPPCKRLASRRVTHAQVRS